MVADNNLGRIWEGRGVRAFVSYTSEHNALAKGIKVNMENYGFDCFVDSESIRLAADPQAEIEKALRSTDLMIALLTPDFSKSTWANQEIGFATAREMPVVPICLGSLPHGLIGKYKGFDGRGKTAAQISNEVFPEMLRASEPLKSLAKQAFVVAVKYSQRYDQSNYLARLFLEIDNLTLEQADSIAESYNANSQLYEAWDFKGRVCSELTRTTGQLYTFDHNRYRNRVVRLER